MSVVEAAALLAAAALILAAALKLARPQRTYIAMRLAGLPNGRGALVALAATEALVGAAVLITRGALASAVMGALYLAFTAFLLLARSKGISCGCLTAADRPPGWLHICLDLAAATAGFASALTSQ